MLFLRFAAMQRRVIEKGMEPIDVDKSRVVQELSKSEIGLNLLLLGLQIKIS